MTDIAQKLRQSYHLSDVGPEHPIARAVAEIEALREERDDLLDTHRRNAELAESLARTINVLRAERDKAMELLRDCRELLCYSDKPLRCGELRDDIDALLGAHDD